MFLFIYYTRLLFCLLWACWVPGSFSGGLGHIFFFFVRGSALWSVGPLLFIWVLAGVGGGAVRVFLFLGSVEAGTVRLK